MESVYDDNGQYRNLSIEEAELIFKKIEEVKTEDLFQHKDSFSTSFISYIETEIRLYTVNGLLNWYENVFKDDLNEEYNNNQHSTVHEKYFQMFLSKKWNRNSIQYFRTVERLTNYNLSKQAGELKLYHEDSEVKDAIRKEILQTTSLNL